MSTTVKESNFGNFGWRIEFRDRIDAEWVVEQLMKTAAFHVKMGTPYAAAPVSRSVKDALIKDSRVI